MGTGFALRGRRRAGVAVLALAAGTPVGAGTLFGTLYRDAGLWPGAGIALACPGQASAAATTDGRGAWRITVPHSGACRLWVASAALDVVVFDQPPLQLDLVWTAGPPPSLKGR